MANKPDLHTERLSYARTLLSMWALVFIILFFSIALLDSFVMLIPFLVVALVGNLHITAMLSGIKCHRCNGEVYLASKNFMAIVSGRCPHCRGHLS